MKVSILMRGLASQFRAGRSEPQGRGACVLLFAGVVALAGCWAGAVVGQEPAGKDEGMVTLNFPQEIAIQGFVDYVSQRLGIKILYDADLISANKKISVKAPGSIPVGSLLPLLESALKMEGFALVDADAPGWKRVVAAKNLPSVARSADADKTLEQYGAGAVVTQAFVLKNVTPKQVEEIIKPFLTQPGANCAVLPDGRTLVVTDFASNLANLSHLVELADRPRTAGPESVLECVPVANAKVTEVAAQVTAIYAARSKAEGPNARPYVELMPDGRTNQILVIGPKEQVSEAKELIRSLDTPLKLLTRTYTFENVSAANIDRMAQQLVGPDAADRYRSVVDRDANLLVVTATEEIHRQIEELRKTRDVPAARAQSPICFYKVKNLPVSGVLETIRSIERDTLSGDARNRAMPTNGRIRPARDNAVPGPNNLPPGAGTTDLPTPPAVTTPIVDNAAAAASMAPVVDALRSQGGTVLPGAEGTQALQLLGQARITADITTNTLIVVAEPRVQRLYAQLIEQLDKRRPQVLIESKFVIVDTSGDFTLGVEVSGGKGTGLSKIFAFSSYGLSTVNASSGALALIPGTGFNGTLVDPDVADVVVRALTTNSRSRVLSAPRVLVNDNQRGQLTSVEEVPFTSVNASTTVATTSFAGFAEAGTTITVTPRISDDSHIELDFSITLNSFKGTGSNGVPPPRTTEEVTSQVTVPDGYTVIVGGLNRGHNSDEYKGIPGLASIPIIRLLSGYETKSRSCSSMFVFIRPVILRDDKFRDLKFLSDREASSAGVEAKYPDSRPVWIR